MSLLEGKTYIRMADSMGYAKEKYYVKWKPAFCRAVKKYYSCSALCFATSKRNKNDVNLRENILQTWNLDFHQKTRILWKKNDFMAKSNFTRIL